MAGGIDWFRWHHGSVNDPKFQLVAKRSGATVAEVIAVWACLLEAASTAPDRGDPGEPDFESMECALGIADGLARSIYDQMRSRDLIDPGSGRVVSWEKRQPKREDDTANERKRRQRERDHEASLVTEDTSRDVTQGHAAGMLGHAREEESREEKKEDPPATRVPRSTRKCPESFAVTAELREWASEKAPSVDLDTETESFRDYTFRNSISDWSGAWRNWMRKAQQGRAPTQNAAKSYRERDADSAALEVSAWTGGLMGKASNVIDMEEGHGPLRIAG